MKKIACVFLLLWSFSSLNADTQDYIRANVILIKSNAAYFDKGVGDGVAPGEAFEIYFDGSMVTAGRIAWADKNISRSEPLDSLIAARISVYRPLDCKIRLLAPQANRGGHLTIPIFAEPHLDPSEIATSSDLMIARLIHRGLLTRDGAGQIIPDLCGDYEIRGLTYTFYISPEAVFHNGKPVESSDVLYSFETLVRAPRLTPFSSFVLEIKGAGDVRSGLKNEIAGIFIIDRKTIAITLEKSFPAFEDYLAGPGGYIIPEPGLVSSGAGIIGAGPYKIEWYRPDAVVIEPNGVSSDAAFLDSLTFLRFDNIDEAGLTFELGRLDMVNLIGEPPPKFVSKGNLSSLTSPANGYVILGINNARSGVGDSYFRKAVSFLFDRETLIRVILGGEGASPIYQLPNRAGTSADLALPFMPDSADYYFDSIKGRIKNVTLYVDSRYPILTNVSRYLIGQIQKQGIKVVERKADLQRMDTGAARLDMDLYLTCYIPVPGNSETVFYPLLSYGLSDETNFLNLADTTFQAMLDQIHTEADPDVRDSVTLDLTQLLYAEQPVIFLYQPHLTSIMRDDIFGMELDPMGFIDLRRAFIEMER